jgi:hypothetical protein
MAITSSDLAFMQAHPLPTVRALKPRLTQPKQNALKNPVSNTVAPVVSGTGTVGQILTTTNGTWVNASTYAYQWLRDGVAIVGATASTYVLVAADSTHAVSCRVTATNAGGSASASAVSNTKAVA